MTRVVWTTIGIIGWLQNNCWIFKEIFDSGVEFYWYPCRILSTFVDFYYWNQSIYGPTHDKSLHMIYPKIFFMVWLNTTIWKNYYTYRGNWLSQIMQACKPTLVYPNPDSGIKVYKNTIKIYRIYQCPTMTDPAVKNTFVSNL